MGEKPKKNKERIHKLSTLGASSTERFSSLTEIKALLFSSFDELLILSRRREKKEKRKEDQTNEKQTKKQKFATQRKESKRSTKGRKGSVGRTFRNSQPKNFGFSWFCSPTHRLL
jgi:hypothetical protein